MGKALIIIVTIVIVGLTATIVLLDKQQSTPQAAAPIAAPTATTQDATGGNVDGAKVVELKAGTKSISITKSGFAPKVAVVAHGSAIVWTNTTDKPVKIVSSPLEGHTDYPALNLQEIAPGQTVTLEFDTAGTYGYKDAHNASAAGVIIVL